METGARAVRELIGDIWTLANRDHAWVVITTNGDVRHDYLAVMGRGIAREAAIRFPRLLAELGERIALTGNHLHHFDAYELITFPVKHHWRELAALRLIERSARELAVYASEINRPVYLVRPGCGNGGLHWDAVRPRLEPYLSGEKYAIIERDV